MNITREQFIVSLKEAFDEGWFGYLELRDEICERIADKVFEGSSAAKEGGVIMEEHSGSW